MKNVRWKCKGKGNIYHHPEDNKKLRCKKENCNNIAPPWYILRFLFHKAVGFSNILILATLASAVVAGGITFVLLRMRDSRLVIIHLVDESASAINNDYFYQTFENTCEATSEIVRLNKDLYSRLSIYSEITEYQDPIVVRSRQNILDNCQLTAHPDAKGGTLVCPAWENVSIQIESVDSNIRPLVITQVHTNEYESFCPEVVELLYKQILDKNGIHLIVGSTNDGGTSFNNSLFNYVNNSENKRIRENTVFIGIGQENCLPEIASYLRIRESVEAPKSRLDIIRAKWINNDQSSCIK